MSAVEVSFAGFVFLFVILAVIGMRAAYRNGVTDGYGYSREPLCPGYAAAGEWLRACMMHRWPELRDDPTDYKTGGVGFTQRRLDDIIKRDWATLNDASRVLLCAWLVLIGEQRGEELGGKHRTKSPAHLQRNIAQYLLRALPGLEPGGQNAIASWLLWFGRVVESHTPHNGTTCEECSALRAKLIAVLTVAAESVYPGAPYTIDSESK